MTRRRRGPQPPRPARPEGRTARCLRPPPAARLRVLRPRQSSPVSWYLLESASEALRAQTRVLTPRFVCATCARCLTPRVLSFVVAAGTGMMTPIAARRADASGTEAGQRAPSDVASADELAPARTRPKPCACGAAAKAAAAAWRRRVAQAPTFRGSCTLSRTPT